MVVASGNLVAASMVNFRIRAPAGLSSSTALPRQVLLLKYKTNPVGLATRSLLLCLLGGMFSMSSVDVVHFLPARKPPIHAQVIDSTIHPLFIGFTLSAA